MAEQTANSTMEAEDGALPAIPDLALAQLAHVLASPEVKDKGDAQPRLMAAVVSHDMAPYYEHLCSTLGWQRDEALLSSMRKNSDAALAKLDEAITDAQENLGDAEIRDAYIARADFLSKIGDKERALSAYREAMDKAKSLGTQMDLLFSIIRLGMFYNDKDIVARNIEKADALLEQGGDWDRRNRLKVYRGAYALSIRDFATCSREFLDTVSTFTASEIMPYSEFVSLTVLASLLVLERTKLKEKLVQGPEIQEVLHDEPLVKQFLTSFYSCQYASFFEALAKLEPFLTRHRLFSQHRRFYIREMRIRAYQQQLQSYRSMTLEHLAASFGVSVSFIDGELSRFISAGRLNCKIDMVNGVVETNRPDCKNAQYQEAIKHGDLLLNKLQKLSQIINV